MEGYTAYDQGREEASRSFEHWNAEYGPGCDNPDEYFRGVVDEGISQVYGEDVKDILNLIRKADTQTLSTVMGIMDANASTGGLIDSFCDDEDEEVGRKLDGAMPRLIQTELDRRDA